MCITELSVVSCLILCHYDDVPRRSSGGYVGRKRLGTVDLAEQYILDGLVIYNRRDCCECNTCTHLTTLVKVVVDFIKDYVLLLKSSNELTHVRWVQSNHNHQQLHVILSLFNFILLYVPDCFPSHVYLFPFQLTTIYPTRDVHALCCNIL